MARAITKKGEPFWDLYRDGITRSALETFLRCPELFRLKYVLGMDSTRRSYAAQFGNVIHDCLDKLYTAWEASGKTSKKASVIWARGWCRTYLQGRYEEDLKKLHSVPMSDPNAIKDLEKAYGLTEAMIPVYVSYWKDDFNGKRKWEALEKRFEFTIPDPLGSRKVIKVRGKRDADFLQGKGLWLFETKSKGDIDTHFLLRKLNFDNQVLLYMVSQWRDYGRQPRGLVYNLIRRPGMREKVNESISDYISRCMDDISKREEYYFQRVEGILETKELESWFENDFLSMMGQLASWASGAYHFKNGTACEQYWGKCDMLSACAEGDMTFYQKRAVPFPELDGEE